MKVKAPINPLSDFQFSGKDSMAGGNQLGFASINSQQSIRSKSSKSLLRSSQHNAVVSTHYTQSVSGYNPSEK
jgi:hypothetical protein